MNKILLLASVCLAGCATVPVDAAAYKTCPGGQQVRKNVTCPTPPPSFAVQDITVAENAGSVTVTVLKTGTTTKSSTISYTTSGGTAVAGTNYKPVSASTTVTAAQTSFTVTIPILDDGKVDPVLTVGLKLTATSNAAISRNGIISITDTDNASAPDPIPYFAITGEAVNENGGPAIVHVTKTGTTTSPSTVTYVTGASGDTAIAGSDYTTTSGTLTFAANETDKTITIPIIDDNIWESNETFTVRIAAGTNALINIGSAAVTIIDDDPVPIQTPPSPTEPVVSPNGTAGELDIADNFTTSTTLIPTVETVPADLDPVGAFRFPCLAGQLLYDDPIVYPGQPGKSHLHQFFGNTGTDANSTYNSLRTTGGSTCTHDVNNNPLNPTGQRTAYWMPAMLDGAGNAVKPDWMNTYYKQLPVSSPDCGFPDATHIGICIQIPNGLRYILGYNMATGVGGPATTDSSPGSDAWRMGFDCVVTDGSGVSYTGTKHTITDIVATGKCPVGAWLRVFLTFKDCWDGVNLDTADHRSHMAYASGAGINGRRACPADHPYNIPEVAVQAFFRTDANFEAGKWSLASDAMVAGALAGTTLHMDYWEAWSPFVKNLWHTGCINGHFSCNVGETGTGQTVVGMQQNLATIPNHVLVPLNTIP